MMDIGKVDLTTPAQKTIAGVFVVLVLTALYFVLPPLVTIFANIWLLIGMGVPLLFLAYNYQLFWNMFKQLSWNLTKKVISTNKLWYMYRYHEYMVNKVAQLGESIKTVGALEISTGKKVAELIKNTKNFVSESENAQKRGATDGIIRILNSKVAINQQQVDTILPKLDYIKKQKDALVQVYDNWEADTEILKHTLDSKAEEYNLMKELSKASDTATAFLQKDSPELKMFNESLKQIEQSVSSFTANVEDFQRKVLPTITMMNLQTDANAEEGARLIEEYKQKRISL